MCIRDSPGTVQRVRPEAWNGQRGYAQPLSSSAWGPHAHQSQSGVSGTVCSCLLYTSFSCTTKYSSDVYSPRPPDIRVRLLPTKPPVHFTTEQPGRDNPIQLCQWSRQIHTAKAVQRSLCCGRVDCTLHRPLFRAKSFCQTKDNAGRSLRKPLFQLLLLFLGSLRLVQSSCGKYTICLLYTSRCV